MEVMSILLIIIKAGCRADVLLHRSDTEICKDQLLKFILGLRIY